MSPSPGRALPILIAGLSRSGANDDPRLIAANVATMEGFALPIFRAGHLPILGEWLALPFAQPAGSPSLGDAAFNEVFQPSAIRLLEKCDAVQCVGGASAGAGEMVRVGRQLGLQIFTSLAELPAP